MLLGNYHNTLDSKNRAFIPSKLRNTLGERVKLIMGLDKCLNIFTLKEWEANVNQYMENLSFADEESRAMNRFYFGGSIECDIDKQGRIVIPQSYLNYASLSKELAFVGCGKYIEVWDKDMFEEMMSPDNLNPSELMKKARQNSKSENDGV